MIVYPKEHEKTVKRLFLLHLLKVVLHEKGASSRMMIVQQETGSRNLLLLMIGSLEAWLEDVMSS